MLVLLVAALMQAAIQGPVSLVRYMKTHAPSFFFCFFLVCVIPGSKSRSSSKCEVGIRDRSVTNIGMLGLLYFLDIFRIDKIAGAATACSDKA